MATTGIFDIFLNFFIVPILALYLTFFVLVELKAPKAI